METTPKISVVTVCYNAVKTIEETILSILNQTYPNIEYIIIDGGSTDGTVKIIEKYANRLAYWVSEADNGIYDAMNKGIEVASGQYINFMNAGDKFANMSALQNVVNKIKSDAKIIVCDWCDIIRTGKIYRHPLDISYLKRDILCSHQASIISLDYHRSHRYDTSFKFCADYNFMYQAYFRDNLKIEYIPVCLSYYRNDEGLSASNIYRLEREKLRIWTGKRLKNRITIESINTRRFIWRLVRKVLPESIILKITQYNLAHK